ncbi:hypothetical protein [Geodermatophilus sp. SYSU D01119]
MVVAVVCLVWVALSLPLGFLLGSALRRADVVDRGVRGRDTLPTPRRPLVLR